MLYKYKRGDTVRVTDPYHRNFNQIGVVTMINIDPDDPWWYRVKLRRGIYSWYLEEDIDLYLNNPLSRNIDEEIVL